ncbi:hypothetical protein XM38_022190 [Halomicronema hongdechloris C2206]|uniref:Pentapeptide repeat-containing protein n=1 Tax=Halomicronema hongdechloris C2206 TaxID=1641165 RepID=A0A1Z3HMB4_9CYAN|nr:hypothetical protein [Halomicronema hongdechloris]ASC71267.1 hypothetical protein XM38_022190 [Halomicronema hongdechloris C2206]
MLSHHTRQIAYRFIAILLSACWLSIAAGSLWSPIFAQQSPTTAPQQTNTPQQAAELERTKTFPYPPQLIPGQFECIVLDRHETKSKELTPQERHARDTWGFPERWIWRHVCAGQEANFHKIFLSALIIRDLVENNSQLLNENFDHENFDYTGLIAEYRIQLNSALQEDIERPKSDKLLSALFNLASDVPLETSLKFLIENNSKRPEEKSFLIKLSELVQILTSQTDKEYSTASLIYENEGTLRNIVDSNKEDYNKLSGLLKEKHQAFWDAVLDLSEKKTEAESGSRINFQEYLNKYSVGNNFLKTILLREPFRSALPGTVITRGAYFNEELDLSSSDIEQELQLKDSVFRKSVRLYKSNFLRSLNLDGSQFEGGIFINNITLQGDLFLRNVILKGNGRASNNESSEINLESLQGRDIILSGDFSNHSINLSDSEINDFMLIFDKETPDQIRLDLDNMVASNVVFDFKNRQPGFQNLFFKERTNESDNIDLLLEDAQVNSFNIIKSDNEEMDQEISGECLIDLNRFHYQKANSAGFSLLTSCLDAKYNKAAPSTWQRVVRTLSSIRLASTRQQDLDESLSLDSELLPRLESLLQPLEQAAMVARSLGKYDMERDLLYKRNRLEVLIEKEQNGRFTAKFIQLTISDFLYGFSYYRFKALRLFVIVWMIGGFLAFRRILRKQSDLIKKVIKSRDLEDALFNKVSVPNICLRQALKYSDSISKILFFKLKSKSSIGTYDGLDRLDLYVKFEPDFELEKILEGSKLDKVSRQNADYIYVNHHQDTQNLKNLVEIINAKQIETFGCGQNIFPDSGKWFFDQKGSCNGTLDLINLKEDQIREHQYPYLNRPRKGLARTIHLFFKPLLLFLATFLVAIQLYVPALYTHLKIPAIIIFILAIAILVPFFVDFATRKLSGWRFRVAWLSMVFSLDILLPIINLDEHLHNFVFEESEGCTRLFFLFQKLMAAVLAGILLPVFFVTGL